MSWHKDPKFSGWLEKDHKQRNDNDLALCTVCETTMVAHKTEICRHSESTKHLKLVKEIRTNKNIVQEVNKN